jgi:hypothetical protein
MGRRRPGEAGLGAIEYVGGVLIAGLVFTAAYAGLAGNQIQAKVSGGVCAIVDTGGCASTTTAAGGAAPTGAGGTNGTVDGTNESRRDAERGTRDNRRGRGEDKSPPTDQLPGPTAPTSPLGEPVNGTDAPEPQPPEWQPGDKGAGEHGSEDAGLRDRAKLALVEAAANALSAKWPDAARNLSHYLDNSGEPLEQDVDKMLKDLPRFQELVDADRAQLGQLAITQAQQRGATGPITFPVNTPWAQSGESYDDGNWFYALGGWNYNQTGKVTVYPPTTPGGKWTYEITTRVNIRDQYNWDGNKSTDIGPINVTDEELAELHRKGLAQEYSVYGSSDATTAKGTSP